MFTMFALQAVTAPLMVYSLYAFFINRLLWLPSSCTRKSTTWFGLLFSFCLLCSASKVHFYSYISNLLGVASRIAHNYRNKCLQATDARIKLLNEILSGIRVIKYYCWEKPFIKKVCPLEGDSFLSRLMRSVKKNFIVWRSLTGWWPSASTFSCRYDSFSSIDL